MKTLNSVNIKREYVFVGWQHMKTNIKDHFCKYVLNKRTEKKYKHVLDIDETNLSCILYEDGASLNIQIFRTSKNRLPEMHVHLQALFNQSSASLNEEQKLK